MKYKDKKWSITHDEKDGLIIYVKCECGFIHDIHLSSKDNLIGRGTLLQKQME